jgi:hypothetical protein
MLAPYDHVTSVIDQALVQLDKGQASVEDVLSDKTEPGDLQRTAPRSDA